jgi:hypothetical protein
MKRFKSSRHAQRFLSAFSGISAHFRPRRHLLSATEWRTEMADRFAGLASGHLYLFPSNIVSAVCSAASSGRHDVRYLRNADERLHPSR